LAGFLRDWTSPPAESTLFVVPAALLYPGRLMSRRRDA